MILRSCAAAAAFVRSVSSFYCVSQSLTSSSYLKVLGVVPAGVVVGSGYVRDGTFLWHRKGRNAVNTSIRGVWMVPVHRRIILAFFAATCLEH